MIKKEFVMTDEVKESTKELKIDADVCIGCGACEGVAPEYFEIKDRVSLVKKKFDPADAELIEDAMDNCPVQAITLD